MRFFVLRAALCFVVAIISTQSGAQSLTDYSKVEMLPFGNMDSWRVRQVEESAVIGGNTKYVYEIAKGDTIKGNKPYTTDPNRQSPWATSSVMAKVSGVTKASVTVFPEKRSSGYAAKCEVCMEQCKALGLLNIQVVASGTIFLGGVNEPISDTKNPQSKLIAGIPFTSSPNAIIFDVNYKNTTQMTKATGFGKPSQMAGENKGECSVILQKRWEDAAGNIFAKRVATGWDIFAGSSNGWKDNHIVPIKYGDISSTSYFKPYMKLLRGSDAIYTKNSKGKVVPIQEEGWATSDEKPTHIIVRFSSSNAEAYTGAIGSYIMVDNVRVAYK